VQTGGWQRAPQLAQRFVLDAPRLDAAQRQLGPLLVDVVDLLAEEAEIALLLAEGHERVAG